MLRSLPSGIASVTAPPYAINGAFCMAFFKHVRLNLPSRVDVAPKHLLVVNMLDVLNPDNYVVADPLATLHLVPLYDGVRNTTRVSSGNVVEGGEPVNAFMLPCKSDCTRALSSCTLTSVITGMAAAAAAAAASFCFVSNEALTIALTCHRLNLVKHLSTHVQRNLLGSECRVL